MSYRVSLVARQHGISGGQVFTWRRLMIQGVLTAAAAYSALEAQVRELHRLLGKKTMENELFREAVSLASGPKKTVVRSTSLPGGWPMSAVAAALDVARPHLSACATSHRQDHEGGRRYQTPS